MFKDEDFVDSVFYRFAKMELPLRSKDIDVSTNSQVKKILLNSITKAAKQTQRLLGALSFDGLKRTFPTILFGLARVLSFH